MFVELHGANFCSLSAPRLSFVFRLRAGEERSERHTRQRKQPALRLRQVRSEELAPAGMSRRELTANSLLS